MKQNDTSPVKDIERLTNTETLIDSDEETSLKENPAYLNEQIITYLGNKRGLLHFINKGLFLAKKRLGKEKLTIFDVFAGSGIVSRFFKQHARKLIVNDLETYSEVINKCYLANRSETDISSLRQIHRELIFELKKVPLQPGLIAELYAPQEDSKIEKGERVFYTRRNAMYLDTARRYIEQLSPQVRNFFLAPLLAEASVHANTSGVFKGFYKDSASGLGKFGGRKGDALLRILGDIALPFPVLSNFDCETVIYREDANKLVNTIEEVDVAYIDPPYNQHPYGSNYFMLNLLVEYKRPGTLSKVSGIPPDWNRSVYNQKMNASTALANLLTALPARFLLISFNSEGFISREEMLAILGRFGEVEVLETRYNTFRGSRNLRNRKIHVKEFLYLLEKKESPGKF